MGGEAGAGEQRMKADLDYVYRAVLHSDPSGAYLARHVGHLSGLPVDVPALTINRSVLTAIFYRFILPSCEMNLVLMRRNRLCGSGFQAIINAAQEIKLGEANVVLTGGAENMSLSPCSSPPPLLL